MTAWTWRYVLHLWLVLTACLCCDTEDLEKQSFFSIKVTDADGEIVSLDKYRGKFVLVVNVASKCVFTESHYKGLVQLQTDLNDTDLFQILAFPCNQFASQEPEPINKILEFAKATYNVNFPIFNKVNTVNDDVADIYAFLTERTGFKADWNFWKYLVSPEGKVLYFWGPWSSVAEITPKIKQAMEVAKQTSKGDPSNAATKSEKSDDASTVDAADEEITTRKAKEPTEAQSNAQETEKIPGTAGSKRSESITVELPVAPIVHEDL